MDPSARILFPIEPSGYPPLVKRGTPACPGCAAPPVRETVGEVSVREGRFRLARCLSCGVVSLDPPPSDAVLAAAYDETYYCPGHERLVPWFEYLPSAVPPSWRRRTPACPGSAAPPVRETVGEVSVREGRFRLARCLSCGVVSLDPPPSDAVLAAAYDETYYGPGHERFVTWVERAAVRLALRRARHVARRVAPPSRVLDVGCGRGEVLRALVRRGYACSGTERDGRSAERARRESGADVRAGDLAGHRFPDAHFDFVMIWHVLEHLRDPEETLR